MIESDSKSSEHTEQTNDALAEQRLAEEELRLSRQWLALHVQQTPLAVIEFDLGGRVRDWNPAAVTIFGFSREEAIGRYWSFMVPQAVWAQLDGIWEALVEQRGGRRSTNENLTKDGRIISCEWFSTPLVAVNGGTIGVASLVMDVTERKEAEKRLRESEERFRLAMLGATDGMWDWNLQTDEVHYSPRWKSMLGYDEGELANHLDTWKQVIHPDDLAPSLSSIQEFLEGCAAKYELEFRLRHKDGHYRNILSRATLVRGDDGEALRLVGTHVDITERKQAEQQIRRSLKEKEALLREVHHRVKNNMAVVSSLLSLQANKIEDAAVRTLFDASRQRVKSMALVHEKLYQTDDLASINFEEYIRSIVAEIISLYRIDTNTITTEINVEDIALDLESAVPCGLIINELLTNAFKYAFPDNRSGALRIHFSTADDWHTLMIKDDGVGLAKGFDYQKASTLGLQIANVLAGQLRGTLQIRSDQGTEALLRFKPNAPCSSPWWPARP